MCIRVVCMAVYGGKVGAGSVKAEIGHAIFCKFTTNEIINTYIQILFQMCPALKKNGTLSSKD